MDIPIFFISARSAEDDMLLALSIGGDDYICKPYSLGVLLAKVKAELKRYEASQKADESTGDENIVTLGDAVINLKKATITRNGNETPLKAMEYKILVYLLRNSDRVIPKEEIFEKIWDTTFVGDVTLNVHIRHLREKIEDDAGQPKFIKTVWGVGFMLDTKGTA
jgi:two-component system response regulator RegX3